MANEYMGKWRILEMVQWDKDFIDLVMPGRITIRKDRLSGFQFSAARGDIGYRTERTGDLELLEFSWERPNESDHAWGRDWALMANNGLCGMLCFHFGNRSSFRTTRSVQETVITGRSNQRGLRSSSTHAGELSRSTAPSKLKASS